MQAEAFALVAHLLQLGVLQPMAGAADAAGRRRRRRRRRRGASGGDSVRLVLDEGKQTQKKGKTSKITDHRYRSRLSLFLFKK